MPEYIHAYVHQHRVGVILKLQCDDTWTLKTGEFRDFANRLALHIAATETGALSLELQHVFDEPSMLVGDLFREVACALGVRIRLIEYCKLEASG